MKKHFVWILFWFSTCGLAHAENLPPVQNYSASLSHRPVAVKRTHGDTSIGSFSTSSFGPLPGIVPRA
jgi:hypothetical protein